MRQFSLRGGAGVLAMAGLALFAESAQAQYRQQYSYQPYALYGYQAYQSQYYPQAFTYPADLWQRQRYDGVCHDHRSNPYAYQQPFYLAPYSGSSYQSYYPPVQNYGYGYPNCEYGAYYRR